MSSIESSTQYIEIATSTTKYHEICVGSAGLHSVQIGWPDATSNATIKLETSNLPKDVATDISTNAMHWYDESTAPDSPVAIVGPAGSAAGNTLIHLGNIGAKRARLKIETSAATKLYITTHGKEG